MHIHELESTMGLACRVWWAFTWRSVLLGLVCGALAGLVMGLITDILDFGKSPTLSMASSAAGLALGVCASIWVMRRLMVKGFGRFRLVVVEK